MQIDPAQIRRRRELSGRSRITFADDAGISHSYLVKLENRGRGNPDPEIVAKIATALGCTIEDLAVKTRKPRASA